MNPYSELEPGRGVWQISDTTPVRSEPIKRTPAGNLWQWAKSFARKSFRQRKGYRQRRAANYRRWVNQPVPGESALRYGMGWPGRSFSRSVISFSMALMVVVRLVLGMVVVPLALIVIFYLLLFQGIVFIAKKIASRKAV